ncbi:MAG: Mrp/NBP35 family ATP-binding protein [Propionibacteriaceae bacterium]|nr:Mrp/NBP35 family ATP-binding protein [Propionibacteriaceae bacterium]
MSDTTSPLSQAVHAALDTVIDPELRRPISDLGMIRDVRIVGSRVHVTLALTIAGCPLRDTLDQNVRQAVSAVPGVKEVDVDMQVMDDRQRAQVSAQLRGTTEAETNPFASPDCTTVVLAIASGKGGVGKSSITVNLAVALAARGLHVGLLDADIYGHSIPDMMGVGDTRPTLMDDMLLPVPAHGVAVMSLGMLKDSRDQFIAWRGPMLDRGLSQLLTEVYWGDLDVLLVDLPPGTGDMPMSVARQLPGSAVIVVTTPQMAAAEVAERAGALADKMGQRVLGVVENMSYLEATCPHCGKDHRVEVFGHGGGAEVAASLARRTGEAVPLLAQIPMDERLRSGGDTGQPIVEGVPESACAQALASLAERLSSLAAR